MIRRARPAAPHRGRPGLYLQITPRGANSWVFRYSQPGHGALREMGLCGLDEVWLGDARRRADEARALLRRGVDPQDARREARETGRATRTWTFREVAEMVIAQKQGGWKSGKPANQWRATLEAHAYPVIGALPRRPDRHRTRACRAATALVMDAGDRFAPASAARGHPRRRGANASPAAGAASPRSSLPGAAMARGAGVPCRTLSPGEIAASPCGSAC